MKKAELLLILIILISPILAYPVEANSISDGYILISPMGFKNSYLLDTAGMVVHEWECLKIPQYSAYLSTSGKLFRIEFNGIIRGYNWNSNLFWVYEFLKSGYILHHDIYINNNNIFAIGAKELSNQELINLGANPSIIGNNNLRYPVILKLNYEGIVLWEWDMTDHLIQDYDPSKPNYGIISENKNRIDINYVDKYADIWSLNIYPVHLNSIEYNPSANEILLTSRTYSEIWVIDCSDSGDIKYRFGNPNAYKGEGEQKLFHPHDGQFLDHGYIVFNNGIVGQKSSIVEISGNSISKSIDLDFFCQHIGGVQKLWNGNYLVTNGEQGKLIEIDSNGNELWEYNTIKLTGIANQVYKARKYPSDYPGLYYLNNNEPNKPSTPKGKTLLEINEKGYYQTLSTDPDNDTIYYKVNWGDGKISDWFGPYESGYSVNFSHSWDYPMSYNISVQAKDYIGDVSEWSDPLRVDVVYTGNYPPEKPSTPKGVENGNISTEYEYSTYTSDPNGNFIYYNFDWGDGNQSGWIGKYLSNEIVTESHSWSRRGSYSIIVKAKDYYGAESNWSDSLIINIKNKIPEKPSINGEIKGKIEMTYFYNVSTIDSDLDDIYYMIDWGDNTTIDWFGPYKSGELVTFSHLWLSSGNYFVRVKAKDIFDAESEWAILEVNMPHTYYQFQNLFYRLINRFPMLEPYLLKYLYIKI